MTIDFAKLREPFHAAEIEWRIGRAGKNDRGVWATAFAYVTNRAIMQRLDEVCGPENWRNEFSAPPNAAPASAALCTIYIKIDGEWVGKSDGADNSDMESTKGGLSDSMKRAAVQWGIGRYLYDLEEGWVEVLDSKGKDTRYQPANDKKSIPQFHWRPPQLPGWALPKNTPPESKKSETPGKPIVDQLKETGKLTTGDQIPPPKELTAAQQQVIDSWANWLLSINKAGFEDAVASAKASLADKKLKPPMIEPMLRRAGVLAQTVEQYDVLDSLVFALMKLVNGKDDVFGKIAADIEKIKDAKLAVAA